MAVGKKLYITEVDKEWSRKKKVKDARKAATNRAMGKLKKHTAFTYGTSDAYFTPSRAHRK